MSRREEKGLIGVSGRRLLGVTLSASAASVIATSAGLASGIQLDKIVLRASQVGPGYRLHQRPDGHGVNGLVTLDMCGYRFTSESARTGRLQVNYDRAGSAIKFSNEVVRYTVGGTQLALQELNNAVKNCPSGSVPSTVQGVPPLTYRVTRLPTTGLLPGSLSLRVTVSGTYKGKRRVETDTAIYQVHGYVLSGIYAYGGSVEARERMALRVAQHSRANLLT